MSTSENGSISSEEGNTSSSSLISKKRLAASKYWVFTFNNYLETEIGSLGSIFSSLGGRYVFAKEVGKEGTPHLQGWVEFSKKFRPIEGLARSASTTGCRVSKIHWEKMKGTVTQAITYCVKEGGPVYSNFDYDCFVEEVVEDRMKGLEFKDWQLEILRILEDKPDPRKIYWYVDVTGGAGKTTFAHYLTGRFSTARVFMGKASDCMHGLVRIKEAGHKVTTCIFDFPRSLNADFLSYQAIEAVKNGLFFSGKYEGEQYRSNVKHVFVFSNEYPDENKMSRDRWVIREI